MQQTTERGKAAAWDVTAWTTGGTAPGATIKLRATPAGSGTPKFTVGCGKQDTTPACHLGAIDPASAHRQLEAQLTIPLQVTVTSVTLTATITATGLRTHPAASGTVTVLAPPAPVGVTPQPLPGVAAPPPALSPGGNAGALFPTLTPGPTAGTSTSTSTSTAVPGRTQPAADTTALPGAASPIGPEVFGAATLALALIFAVTRLSVRRRPQPAAAKATTAAAPQPATREKHRDEDAAVDQHPQVPPVDPEAP